MKNEIACLGIPSEGEFQILQVLSRNASASGLYSGVGSEQKILMVLLAARELGIPPMQALNGGIWNIQGKIEISARLMNSMIRRAGHHIVVKHCDSQKCIIEGKRVDSGDCFISQFTIEDAQKAGLTTKQIWKSYTEDMLYSRAMSRLSRRLFSDVIGTAYVEGEIRDSKYEVIPEIIPQFSEETEKEKNELLDKFCETFNDNDDFFSSDCIKTYLGKYSVHWKKTIRESIHDYQDPEKFSKDFTRWKKKEISNSISG